MGGGIEVAKVYVFLADGFEEMEALIPVDLLRRLEHQVCLVSVSERRTVQGSHGIRVETEARMETADLEDGDLYILPGGLPGTHRLAENKKLEKLLLRKAEEGKHLAAICAAPGIFGKLGLLQGKRAVCAAGREDTLLGAQALDLPTVTDGKITTAKGAGTSIDFGLELIRVLDGEEKAAEMKKKIAYLH